MASRLASLAAPTREPFKRAGRGLYAGKTKLSGNNVSFSQRKTRRSWKPNAQWAQLYSETLDRRIRVRVTAHALRCIDQAGGLDNYLTQTRPDKLGSEVALKWRARILQTRQVLDLIDEARAGASTAETASA
mmetsp:Transcript_9137/g.21676  ORF Transcript_9137/g.21676 Transcript_9137/m.21676 type:complete len:132 (-) Transcript_9137:49-444(-)